MSSIGVYYVTVHVPGLSEFDAFNAAWGFADGACNELKNGVLVGKPGSDDPDYQKAFKRVTRGFSVKLRVEVFKDGGRKATVVIP